MPEQRPLISVIVPVWNEERTIVAILDRLSRFSVERMQLEVIIVDDGSTDRTPELLASFQRAPDFVILRHSTNRGKGAAFRTALAHATGPITIVQDADLEYDPDDLPALCEALRTGEPTAAYGSRYMAGSSAAPWNIFRVGVEAMNWLVFFLYGRRISDVATCYKALPTDLYRKLDLQATRFELCAEITAKLCRMGIPIKETPIRYHPRSIAEGKKIGLRDAFAFAWTLFAWRFRRVQPAGGVIDAARLNPAETGCAQIAAPATK